MPLIIAAFLTGSMGMGCITAVIIGLFAALPIALGKVRLNGWSWGPVAVLTVLSWMYLLSAVPYGLKYQGLAYVISCIVANAILTLTLVALAIMGRTRRCFPIVVAFHAVAAFWFVSYAFPYMGELP
ncbi:MAG: hypothetical protein ACREJO_17870 [Phycisphaerales bacterium]